MAYVCVTCLVALAVRDGLNMPMATSEKVEYRSGILREMEGSFGDKEGERKERKGGR